MLITAQIPKGGSYNSLTCLTKFFKY